MNGSISVQRHDYSERVRILPSGKPVLVPTHYESRYFWNGIEIAYYDSKNDIIFLRSRFLARNKSTDYLKRMKTSSHSVMWNDLIEFLGINSDTSLGEYVNE